MRAPDGLDALLAECALERSSSSSAVASTRTCQASHSDSHTAAAAAAAACSLPTNYARATPSSLLAAGAPDARSPRPSTGAEVGSAVDTWRYYDDRPELARYTIERELARNTFVVDGRRRGDRRPAAAESIGGRRRVPAAPREPVVVRRLPRGARFRARRNARRRPSRTPPARHITSRLAARRASRAACASPSTCRRSTASAALFGDARRRRDAGPRRRRSADGVDRPRGDGQRVFDDDIRRDGNRDRLAHGGAAGRSRRPRRTPGHRRGTRLAGGGRRGGAPQALRRARAAAPEASFSDLLARPQTARRPRSRPILRFRREAADREAGAPPPPPPPAERFCRTSSARRRSMGESM